jgi:hypothetical protein
VIHRVSTLPGWLMLGVRLGLGGASVLAPDLVLDVMGLDPDANPQSGYGVQLFGVRDAMLGVGLLSTEGDARRVWWRVGIACDLVDAASGAWQIGRGRITSSPRSWVTLVGAGLVGAALGTAALCADDT